MQETNILESLTHLSEIITDAINGIGAFLLYWPFIWLFFHLELLKTSPYDVIECSYAGLAGIIVAQTNILGLSLIILVLPFIGLLNRAIIHTFIGTVQKYINSFPLLCEIPKFVRGCTMKTIKKQLNLLLKDKELSNIDNSLYPSWRLQGSFDFANYRHWLIKNPSRKSYWDWEHFMDWVYKMYYQTFLMFLILYSVLLIIADNHSNCDIFVFILILPTYALYREYLLHHIAWIRMDQKFFVEYLIEEKEDIIFYKCLLSIDAALIKNYSNKDEILKVLKVEFKTNNIQLSGIFTIREILANKWKITDGKKIYIVKKKGNKLNIYEYITKNDIKTFLEKENYEEVEETLKEYLRNKKGYDIDQINIPERCISVKEPLTKMARWLQTQVKRWKK